MISAEEETISQPCRETWAPTWPDRKTKAQGKEQLNKTIFTNNEIALSNELQEISRSSQKRSTYHTEIQPPLDQFHTRQTENQLEDQTNEKGILNGVNTDIIVHSKSSNISEVDAESNCI